MVLSGWVGRACGLVLGALIVGVAAGGRAAEPGAVVNCFDPERQVVTKTIRGRCTGRVVDDAEAATIEAKRRAYKQRVISGPAEPGASSRRRPPERRSRRAEVDGPRLKGIGSAFFVTPAGHLVTNYHVVAPCKSVTVSPATGETAAASLVAASDRYDLALLKASIRPRSVARFSAARSLPPAVHVGIVGYPNRGLPTIRPQLTPGETNGTFRIGNRFTALQLRADVRFGNSGGPVLDRNGNVVGVVFGKVNTVAVHRHTGKVIRDVGYAVPTALTKRFLGKHKVGYRNGSTSNADADLLDTARSFVARVNCY